MNVSIVCLGKKSIVTVTYDRLLGSRQNRVPTWTYVGKRYHHCNISFWGKQTTKHANSAVCTHKSRYQVQPIQRNITTVNTQSYQWNSAPVTHHLRLDSPTNPLAPSFKKSSINPSDIVVNKMGPTLRPSPGIQAF